MKIGRLITEDGLELSVESAQVIELADYLRRRQLNETIADEAGATISLVDPEEFERAAQAAYFAQAAKARPAAA